MGPFTKGEIVIYAFPYTDLSSRKVRPCLVMSDTLASDVLLCQMTSQQSIPDQYSVAILEQDMEEGSLAMTTLVRAEMLFTAEHKQIERKIGKISNEKYNEVTGKIIKLIT